MRTVDVLSSVWFGVGLLAVTGMTIGLNAWAGTRLGLFPLWAILRAAVQLGVVALLLRGILSVPGTVAGFVLLMLATASFTSAGRIAELWHGRRAAAIGVVSGAAVTLVVLFGLRLVDPQVRYVVAVGGIVIGSTMSAATLTGRNFLRAAATRTSEIEAWLSMGATPAQAHQDIGREAVREALIPGLDQTRSTGLVTLPGAFVGALFGGASPIEAAQFQLVVLVGLGLAGTITGIVVARMVGRSPYVGGVHA